MDPSQRPDRDLIAKEIDKLDNGRPVTQYDVLAWMQTKKRMIKKKEERAALLKEQMRPGSSMHSMSQGHVAVPVWQMQQQPFLVHGNMPSQPGPDGQPPPPPDDGVGQQPLTPGAQGSAMGMGGMPLPVGQVGVLPQQAGGLPASTLAAKQAKIDKIKRPRMDYNDAQARLARPPVSRLASRAVPPLLPPTSHTHCPLAMHEKVEDVAASARG